MEAKKLGFERDPYVAVKIYNRSLQLLVNESYEQLVALPLINPDDIAREVLHLVNQKKSAWTFDHWLRPYGEHW